MWACPAAAALPAGAGAAGRQPAGHPGAVRRGRCAGEGVRNWGTAGPTQLLHGECLPGLKRDPCLLFRSICLVQAHPDS